ncbi:hypothetical protein [Rhizobium sp. HT1-10]|uniref:hypothetical protein n=1 Tax=Rhizobium sp. HT1-10 TaxID=3111638 RepID=UPI003C19ED23
MSTMSSAATTTTGPTTASAMDTPEFIRRLAEDQRIKSGSDLPLSCFIEQVKMQLKGRRANDVFPIPQDRITRRASANRPIQQTSDLFQAWAMPD